MTAAVSDLPVSDMRAYSRYRFVIAVLILWAHCSIGLNFFAVTPLLPLAIDDYDITRASASLLVALPTLVKACVGLPGSLIINRFGLNRVFTVSWFMLGMLALSPWIQEFYLMLLLRLLYGIGTGLMMTATASLIMQWFRPREVPIINTLLLIVISLGIAISIPLAAPLAKHTSWEGVLGVFGFIGLCGACAWTLCGRTQSTHIQESSSIFTLREVWEVFRDRTIFLLVVGDALVFVNYAAVTSWLPTFLHEFRGMNLDQAGYVTGLLPAVGIFAVLLGGFLAVRVQNRRLLFLGPGIMVAIGGFGAFLLRDPLAINLAILALGFGTWVYQPALLTLPMQLSWMTPRKITVVWGASLTIAGFGMFISPVVVGASRDLFGTFVPGFSIWAVFGCALIFTGVLLPKQRRHA
ncbi:MAG: MFS transporter [Chloroflexi bacterium]|nr:MFS transporter [Chloroflexota bacterium]